MGPRRAWGQDGAGRGLSEDVGIWAPPGTSNVRVAEMERVGALQRLSLSGLSRKMSRYSRSTGRGAGQGGACAASRWVSAMSSREDFAERGAVSLELPSGFAARKRFPLEKEDRSRRVCTFFPSGTENPRLEAGGYRKRRGRYTL